MNALNGEKIAEDSRIPSQSSLGWKSVANTNAFGVPLPGWLGGGNVQVPPGLLNRAGELADQTIDTGKRGVDLTGQAIGTGKKIVDVVDGAIDDFIGKGTSPTPPPGPGTP